eukprot:3701918-Amphidinium_carterae.1
MQRLSRLIHVGILHVLLRVIIQWQGSAEQLLHGHWEGCSTLLNHSPFCFAHASQQASEDDSVAGDVQQQSQHIINQTLHTALPPH